MRAFVDTSAFLAFLDADDKNHQKARKVWADLIDSDAALFCSNYVLVETFALVQHRLGIEAVRTFNDDVLPLISIKWIDDPIHKAGLSAMLAVNKRKLSLVDCVSFETMRQLELNIAFTFDRHFAEQGFRCIP